jgi:hypothetical protein
MVYNAQVRRRLDAQYMSIRLRRGDARKVRIHASTERTSLPTPAPARQLCLLLDRNGAVE